MRTDSATAATLLPALGTPRRGARFLLNIDIASLLRIDRHSRDGQGARTHSRDSTPIEFTSKIMAGFLNLGRGNRRVTRSFTVQDRAFEPPEIRRFLKA